MGNSYSQTFTLNIKAIADMKDVLTNVNSIQSALSKMKLPPELKNSFKNTFGELEKEVGKYQELLNKKNPTKGDVTGLEKSGEKILKLYQSISEQMNKISDKDLKAAFKDLGAEQFEATKKALDEIQNKIKEISSKSTLATGLKSGFADMRKSLGETTEDINKVLDSAKRTTDTLFTNLNTGRLDLAANSIERLRKKADELGDSPAQKKFLEWVDGLSTKLTQLKEDSNIESLTKQFQDLKLGLSQSESKFIANLVQGFRDGSIAIDETTGELRKLTNEDREAAAAQAQLNKELGQVKSRIQYFLGLNNAVNLVKRSLRGAFETIKSLDKAMTETAVVTNFTVQDMWKQLPQYTAMANSLGVTTQAAYESATLFYQQGLETEQVMALSVETLKMARIAGLDAAEATDRMTNALRGFNMELNTTNAQRVDDVYSNLAARTASNVDEISTAMTKVASLAHNANMEFETTAAFLAQIIESTRESAETAGTALKTVVARFSEVKKLYSEDELSGKDEEGEIINVNKISTALRTAGIDLNKYFLGEVGLDDIFMELASKWDSLTKVQQRYIATQAAGSRQQSRFIALMQDYARTQELVGYAYNSNGAAARQFEKTQDSLESKLARLKNAWNEFLMGLANNKIIKGAVDLFTNLLNKINEITDSSNSLEKTFRKWGLALASFIGLRSTFGQNGLFDVLLKGKLFNIFDAPKLGKTLFSRLFDKNTISKAAKSVPEIISQTITKEGSRTITETLTRTVEEASDVAGKTGGRALLSSIGSVLSSAWPLLAVGAAVGLTALIHSLAKKAAHEAIYGALEEAQEQAEGFKELTKSITEEVGDLQNGLDGIKNAQEAFDSAVIGTNEWYTALNEVNQKIDEIVQQTPELNDLVSFEWINGRQVKTIDLDAYQETIDAANMSSHAAEAMFNFSVAEQKRQELLMQQNSLDSILAEYEKNKGIEALPYANFAWDGEGTVGSNDWQLFAQSEEGKALFSAAGLDPKEWRTYWEQGIDESIITGLKNAQENTATEINDLLSEFITTLLSSDRFSQLEHLDLFNALGNILVTDVEEFQNDYEEAFNNFNSMSVEAQKAEYNLLTNGAIFTGDVDDLPDILASLTMANQQEEALLDKYEQIGDNWEGVQLISGDLNVDLGLETLQEQFKHLKDIGLVDFNTDFEDLVENIRKARNSLKGRWTTNLVKEFNNAGVAIEQLEDSLNNLFNGTLDWDLETQLNDFLTGLTNSEFADTILTDIFANAADPDFLQSIVNTWGTIDLTDKFTIRAAVEAGQITQDQVNQTLGSAAQITAFDEFEHFYMSEGYDAISEDLQKLIQANEEITADKINELAKSSDVLRDYLDRSTISAEALAKVLNGLESGAFVLTDISSAVLEAMSNMDSFSEMTHSTLEALKDFKAGDDEGGVADFFSTAYDKINELWENGEVGNSQIAAYLETIFGQDVLRGLSGADYETRVENLMGVLKQVKDEGSLESLWSQLANAGTDLVSYGENGQIELNIGDMTSDEFIGALQDEFKDLTLPDGSTLEITDELLRFMLTDFKNFSSDVSQIFAENGRVQTREEFIQGAKDRYVSTQELAVMANLLGESAESLEASITDTRGIIDFSKQEARLDVLKGLGIDESTTYSDFLSKLEDVGLSDYADVFANDLGINIEDTVGNMDTTLGDIASNVSILAENSEDNKVADSDQADTDDNQKRVDYPSRNDEDDAQKELREAQAQAANNNRGLSDEQQVLVDEAAALIQYELTHGAGTSYDENEVFNKEAAAALIQYKLTHESGTSYGNEEEAATAKVLSDLGISEIEDYLNYLQELSTKIDENTQVTEKNTAAEESTPQETSNESFTPELLNGEKWSNLLQSSLSEGFEWAMQSYDYAQSQGNTEDAETMLSRLGNLLNNLDNPHEEAIPLLTSAGFSITNTDEGYKVTVESEINDEDISTTVSEIQEGVQTGLDDSQIIAPVQSDKDSSIAAGHDDSEFAQQGADQVSVQSPVEPNAKAAYQAGLADASAYNRGFRSAADVNNSIRLISGAIASGGLIRSAAKGTLKPGPTLTGEEGQELVWNKEKGYAYLTGVDYPEIRDLQPGDRVFDARMTKKILGSMAGGGIIQSAATAHGYGSKKKLTSSSSSGSGSKSKGSGSGSGSKSSSDDEKKWQNQLDWLYNVMEDIAELERIQTKLQEDYDDYLKDQSKTGKDLYNLLINQLGNLYTQLDHQTFVLEKREQEMREFMDTTNKYDQYLWYNWNDRTLEIDWDGIEAIQDEETYKEVADLVSEAEKIQKNMDTAEDAITKIQNQIDELENIWRETFTDFEDRVLDALIKSYQQVIDNFSELNTTLNNSNSEILNSIQKEINLARQIRDNTKTEEGIADSEARLAFLRRDTTGGNQLAAMQLEKELAESRQDYEDTLVDQAISRLQDDNDAAAQQREKQIEIMQAQLDYQSESGEFNAAVRELLESAIGDNGELLTNSDLVDLLQKQENWQAMSDVSKEVWEEELNSTFKEVAAFLLKENAQENGTFITALTGAVQGVSAVIGSYSQAMQKLGQTVTKAASGAGGGGGSSGGGNSGGGSGGGNTPGTQLTATTSALKNPVRVLQETTTTVKGFADVLKKVTSITTNSPFKIPGRKNGGLVSQTGIGLLHGTISEPEYVLNARQTDAFLRLADVLPSLMSGESTSTSNMFGGINLNLVMNVDEIGSDYDVDRIANRVKDIIYNASTYRNVNTLSLTR